MSETKWTPREQVIVEFARWISDWASITHRKGVQERVREFVAELEAVPASDPRALALEEAASGIENGTIGVRDASRDGMARDLRALSGSESPRAEGAGRPLEHLAALRLDATAVPSSAVLPLSGVPIGTVLLALIEEVEASRRAGLPVETAGSESPRPAGKVLACSVCGWTAEPCQHIGAWLERHGPVNEREGAESPRDQGERDPACDDCGLTRVPFWFHEHTSRRTCLDCTKRRDVAGRPVETGSEERDG